MVTPKRIVKGVTRRIAGIVPTKPSFIWAGVYSSFGDVPATGAGHANVEYIENTRAYTRSVMQAINSSSVTPAVPAEYSPFTILGSVLANQNGRLTVLDVGGGLGISYIYLRASVPTTTNINYQVCEVEPVCDAGRQLFSSNNEISFSEGLPDRDTKIDLVQFCSSLQYIEQYDQVIDRVCELEPSYIFVLKIPVGSAPTFASGQYNLPESVTPVWFIKLDELKQLFGRHGYQLVSSGTHDREYDMSNFEPSLRVNRYSHLLFGK